MNTRQKGFTLIELMIVVSIVGILAAIAYPSYREQVRRSNRTEGKAALLRVAQELEKCYTRFMTYETVAGQCDARDQAFAQFQTEGRRYRISGEFPRGGAPAGASSYLLTATPLGPQAGDANCMNFMIDETGRKTVSGPGPATTCW